MSRLISIDILRAIAILLMVQVHFVQNLSPRSSDSPMLYDLSEILGLLPAPIFTFLVGLSLWFWIQKQPAAESQTFKLQTVRRGLFLFGYGLAFAVLIWLPDQIFIWDILTFIGLATLIVFALRNWSSVALMTVSVAILMISPPLRELTGYANHWTAWGEYYYTFTMADVLLGMTLHGYFPLLPWIIFPLIGYIVGRYLFHPANTSNQTKWLIPTLGGGLIALAFIITVLRLQSPFLIESYAADLSFYPATAQFIFLTLGLTLMSFSGLHYWLDGHPIKPQLRFFQLYSRYSLTAYVVHHAVHIWPLYLMARWAGQTDPFWFYMDAVSTPVALGLTFVFVIVFYFVLVLWDRYNGKYSLEWQLRTLNR